MGLKKGPATNSLPPISALPLLPAAGSELTAWVLQPLCGLPPQHLPALLFSEPARKPPAPSPAEPPGICIPFSSSKQRGLVKEAAVWREQLPASGLNLQL
ncbi:histidine ammonia-lyase [Platysternon megacephalum]|uniref:Histidine ammonia-lyase n=1 Tax=Platysternon megacephalum TaxID=55544 RepID=A0A4D9EEH2_9SAUR|nr:histidine ammonia-lyase [Platysternon megacephalum]